MQYRGSTHKNGRKEGEDNNKIGMKLEESWMKIILTDWGQPNSKLVAEKLSKNQPNVLHRVPEGLRNWWHRPHEM